MLLKRFVFLLCVPLLELCLAPPALPDSTQAGRAHTVSAEVGGCTLGVLRLWGVMVWKAEQQVLQGCQYLPQLLQGCVWGCPSQLDLGMVVGLRHLQSLLLSPEKRQKV